MPLSPRILTFYTHDDGQVEDILPFCVLRERNGIEPFDIAATLPSELRVVEKPFAADQDGAGQPLLSEEFHSPFDADERGLDQEYRTA